MERFFALFDLKVSQTAQVTQVETFNITGFLKIASLTIIDEMVAIKR